MVNPVSSTDTSASGWGFATEPTNAVGHMYGIAAAGYITTGTTGDSANFANSNTSPNSASLCKGWATVLLG